MSNWPQSGYTNPKCVFWNDTLRDWSSEGCSLIDASGIQTSECDAEENARDFNDTREENIVCGCNHLTNFAVLMVNSKLRFLHVPFKTSLHVICDMKWDYWKCWELILVYSIQFEEKCFQIRKEYDISTFEVLFLLPLVCMFVWLVVCVGPLT